MRAASGHVSRHERDEAVTFVDTIRTLSGQWCLRQKTSARVMLVGHAAPRASGRSSVQLHRYDPGLAGCAGLGSTVD